MNPYSDDGDIDIDIVMSERLDNEVFEYKKSVRCPICQGPAELSKIVDSMLVQPYSYAQIIRLIDPLQDKLNIDPKDRIKYRTLINHRANHLPFEKIATRLLLEEKARQRGKKILEGVDSILTADAFYTKIADITWNDVVEGITRPTLKEGMEAMRMKYEIEEADKGDSQYEVVMSQFNLLLELIKKYCSPDQINLIVGEIEASRRTSPLNVVPEIEEAQVVR